MPVLHSSPKERGASASDARLPPTASLFAPIVLTPVVLLVHGYHPFAGDAGIYVAGIRHLLDPSLYPLNAAFPAAFTRLSVFAWLLAAVVRLAHLRLAWLLLIAHLASVFLFLLACRQLAARVFATEGARVCAVLLAAGCLTLPVAGTALVIMDPYVTARSFSTPLSLMAVAACLDRAWGRGAVLLLLAGALHPLMGAYAVVFAMLCGLITVRRTGLAVVACGLLVAAAGVAFLLDHNAANSPGYRQAIALAPRSFLFLARWQWYEMLGLVLPLILFALAALRGAEPVRILSLTSVLVGITSILIAALFVPTGGPWILVPFQVLRSFHLIYAVGIVLCGGVVAALAGRSRIAASSLLVVLFAGMFAAESFAWPLCERVESPWTVPANPWQQAFLWIRDCTPQDAVFAFNPELVYLPDEDEQGFRAIAERDHLADDKDAGVVAVIPHLADGWARQRNTEFDVDRMTDAQRVATLVPLGANWLLLPPDAETALPCLWRNRVVKVCRLAR
ncbi:MAG: hypothetical protein ACLGXA_09095 [Acidobacteriota bacterium]